MRYARLKKDWLLRGWTDEPRTLLNWHSGDCRQLSEAMFQVAQACNGQADFDHIDGYLQKNILLGKLIAKGFAEECSPGEQLDPYQQYRLADNPYIQSVHWSITGRCNLKCRHCYMESPKDRYGELALPEILHIIDQFAASNIHQVELTGGEPFLRPDLLGIMNALAEKQISVSQIYSNGVLITADLLDHIKKLGFLPFFQISFDGCGTHDAMRGLSGTEAATVQAIRLLREHGFPVTVATSIDKTNISTLAATYELMQQLGIQSWRVAPPQSIGNWRHSTTSLTGKDILTACAPITARWGQDGKPFRLQMPGYRSTEGESQNRHSPENYDCISCRLTCSLLPDGTVIPCPGYTDTVVYKQMPNLLSQPFAKIWSESALRTILDIKKSTVLAHNSDCAACEHFPRCGAGCRAMAVSATGDLLAVDPEFCDMYKTSYHQRFIELAGLVKS